MDELPEEYSELFGIYGKKKHSERKTLDTEGSDGYIIQRTKNYKEIDMADETEFRYDTQLLIEGKNLDEEKIKEHFLSAFKGDCLIAVGDSELIKIHFHTNEPWQVLEYCASLGEIFDIVVEDMDRQSRGLQG